jgi:hypothetical protein
MPDGGGFCQIHGPFDPPHLECPFCKKEQERRRAYGPPGESPRYAPLPRVSPPPAMSSPPMPDDSRFVRQTLEPENESEATEILPRDSLEWSDIAEDDEFKDTDIVPPLCWLIVKRPRKRRGTILPIKANQSIGREADVKWDDPRLSRQHARLTIELSPNDPDSAPVFYMWPFGPKNPVLINGEEIRGATPLHENDEIQLGHTLFVFKMLTD